MSRVFRLQGTRVAVANATYFPTHEALRKVVEENLDMLFGLRYLETAFHLVDVPADLPRECRHIDTLAFDPTTYAPVAIEYRDRVGADLAAQGEAMMRALPTQGQVLRYLAKRAGFAPDRIEWGKARVLFIGREGATVTPVPSRARDGGTELWKCELYSSDFLLLDHLVTYQPAQAPAAAPPRGAPAAA
jgi:hypothetical protein